MISVNKIDKQESVEVQISKELVINIILYQLIKNRDELPVKACFSQVRKNIFDKHLN